MQPRTESRPGDVDVPSGTAPSRARQRSVASSRAALAEWGVYLLTVALVLWPGILHARDELLGGSDDARYYAWLGWRMGRLIAHGHLVPVRIADVISPFGLDLRLLDGYLPSYVSGLFNVVVGPVLAYNLTFVAGALLNIVAARSLARRLTSRRLVQTITAVAFLTAPPIAISVQLGLLPLFWAFTVPLLIGDAIDVARGDRGVRPVRLAILLAIAYLCSVYFLVFAGLAYGVIVGIAALRRRSWRIPLATAGAIALAVIVLLPFVVTRLRFDRAEAKAGGTTELLADSNLYSADAVSIVAQPTRSTFLFPRPSVVDRGLARLPNPNYALEATIFPGLLLLAGFVGFVIASRSSLRLPLTVAAVLTWLLALGPSLKYGGHFLWKHGGAPVSWLPYRLLLAVPALGSLRAPIRAGYVLVGLCAAGTAAMLHQLLSDAPRRAIAVALGSAALLATNLLIPLPTVTMNTTVRSEDAFREMRRLARPGDTVLRVPSDCDPSFVSYQVVHHTPVVGCAGSFAANPWRSKLIAYTRSTAITKLRCDRTQYGRIETRAHPLPPFGPGDLVQLRREFGVRFVVVDRSLLRFGCPAVSAAVPFLERHRSLGGGDRFEVLDLSAPAR